MTNKNNAELNKPLIVEFGCEPVNIWPFSTIRPKDTIFVIASFETKHFKDYYFDLYNIPLEETIKNSIKKRQAEFLAGRVCAINAASLLGIGITSPKIGHNREPVWEPPLIGSITHSYNIAAAAVTKMNQYSGIGIDCEPYINSNSRLNLKHLILTEYEYKYVYLHSNSSCHQEKIFTIIYSLKESLFKALFGIVGCYFDFKDAEVVQIDLESGKAKLRLLINLSLIHKIHTIYEGLFVMDDLKVTTLIFVEKYIN